MAVILYQMVTGDIPFRADSPVAIVSRHLVEPPLPPSRRRPDLRLPKIVDDVVLRGLEKDRELRYPTAAAFREVLEGVLGATSGPATPLPPNVRASSPTMKDITGTSSPGTATVPAQPPAARFGTTANMTGRSRRQTPILVLSLTALFAAFAGRGRLHVPHAQPDEAGRSGGAGRAGGGALGAASAAAPADADPRRDRAAPRRRRRRKRPSPQPPRVPAPRVRDHARPRHHGTAARRARGAGRRRRRSRRLPERSAPAPAAPPARDAAQVLGEADKLLAQGEVPDACARGEEAKRLGPRLPAVYKFLGKCYMRAGRARDANDNYKKYLELAPNASDAPFVKSMIK